jgi:hypothetical protein
MSKEDRSEDSIDISLPDDVADKILNMVNSRVDEQPNKNGVLSEDEAESSLSPPEERKPSKKTPKRP